jgi:hypothetical protein
VRSLSLSALLLLGLALPAQAFPTAVVNVPTAGVTPFKSYHLGTYHYLKPSLLSTPDSPYLFEGSFVGGVLPFYELAPGVESGALEVGVDLMYPFPGSPDPGNVPMPLQPHFKLGVLRETETLPGLALGAYSLSLPNLEYSHNVLHFTATKWLSWNEMDLGQFTLGLYHANPAAVGSDNNGWMAGYFRNLPLNLFVMGDYTSGSTHIAGNRPLGGANAAVGYSINNSISLTGGYYVAGSGRSEDRAFLFIDWVGDLPL